MLGVKVAASTVWEILHDTGIDPAPERSSTTWADFLRSQAEALLACDFFDTVTLTRARLHVLAVIEHANRRIRIPGATARDETGSTYLRTAFMGLTSSRGLTVAISSNVVPPNPFILSTNLAGRQCTHLTPYGSASVDPLHTLDVRIGSVMRRRFPY